MKKNAKSLTAREAVNRLNEDPIFRAAAEERDARIINQERIYAEAEKDILCDLASAGFTIESVWDLGAGATSSSAVPILLEHLDRDYPDRVREGIARALAVPAAIIGWEKLIQVFSNDPDKSGFTSKAGVACAIEATSNDDVIGDVVQLVMNGEHGDNRILLLDALARSKRPEVVAYYESLKNHPDFKNYFAGLK